MRYPPLTFLAQHAEPVSRTTGIIACCSTHRQILKGIIDYTGIFINNLGKQLQTLWQWEDAAPHSVGILRRLGLAQKLAALPKLKTLSSVTHMAPGAPAMIPIWMARVCMAAYTMGRQRIPWGGSVSYMLGFSIYVRNNGLTLVMYFDVPPTHCCTLCDCFLDWAVCLAVGVYVQATYAISRRADIG